MLNPHECLARFAPGPAQVELYVQPGHAAHSKVLKNTLEPVWKGETHYLPVQDPDSQVGGGRMASGGSRVCIACRERRQASPAMCHAIPLSLQVL